MPRKHNVKHHRAKSRYPQRPGMYSHGRLEELETLRKRQTDNKGNLKPEYRGRGRGLAEYVDNKRNYTGGPAHIVFD